jgi:protein subunit release factor B
LKATKAVVLELDDKDVFNLLAALQQALYRMRQKQRDENVSEQQAAEHLIEWIEDLADKL